MDNFNINNSGCEIPYPNNSFNSSYCQGFYFHSPYSVKVVAVPSMKICVGMRLIEWSSVSFFNNDSGIFQEGHDGFIEAVLPPSGNYSVFLDSYGQNQVTVEDEELEISLTFTISLHMGFTESVPLNEETRHNNPYNFPIFMGSGEKYVAKQEKWPLRDADILLVRVIAPYKVAQGKVPSITSVDLPATPSIPLTSIDQKLGTVVLASGNYTYGKNKSLT